MKILNDLLCIVHICLYDMKLEIYLLIVVILQISSISSYYVLEFSP